MTTEPKTKRVSKARKQVYGSAGLSGLERYGGDVFEEFLPELRGLKGIKVYEKMSLNDPVIGAVLFAIQMLIRQVEWNVEFGDEQIKGFVEDCLKNMDDTWTEIVSEIVTFLQYGWSWHEILYQKRSDGRIGWKGFPGRTQKSWSEWKFSDDGAIEAMVQRAAPDFRDRVIPSGKSMLFRTTIAKNNPEGQSILRTAYRPWYFKNHIEKIQGVGIERDLAGLPVASVPPEILDPDAPAALKLIKEEVKRIVVNIRRDEQEGVVFPSAFDENGNRLYDLKLLSTGGSRQFDTTQVMEYYDQRIAMTTLADFVLLGHGRTGSFALSTSKTKMFTYAISAFVDMIAAVFNKRAIPDLLNLNGIFLNEYPKIKASEVEDVDLNALGMFINRVAGSGATLFPDDALENDLRRKANLPSKSSKTME